MSQTHQILFAMNGIAMGMVFFGGITLFVIRALIRIHRDGGRRKDNSPALRVFLDAQRQLEENLSRDWEKRRMDALNSARQDVLFPMGGNPFRGPYGTTKDDH